jgi:hypothetical protein
MAGQVNVFSTTTSASSKPFAISPLR